ncbi:hypothetical protein ACI8B_320004 [Acinetobacter proteolyticus]|jgi:hypothetical protein|uniref:Uncharacterized protein n=1 Tax=Acinetobacter proteolyticus TaxID=1776741 RepID=A0A653K9A0_9GAMM|nr:hypothetical protein ACI8B_320004 [Acinetobacter proteolyticus]
MLIFIIFWFLNLFAFHKMSIGSNFDQIDAIQIKSVNSIFVRCSYIE